MKALSASAAALFAALTLLVIAPAASATFSGENGRIVFGRNTGHVDLFTVRPNGEGLFRLTNPPGNLNTFSADWSPNGRWVAYTRLGEEVRGYIFAFAETAPTVKTSRRCRAPDRAPPNTPPPGRRTGRASPTLVRPTSRRDGGSTSRTPTGRTRTKSCLPGLVRGTTDRNGRPAGSASSSLAPTSAGTRAPYSRCAWTGLRLHRITPWLMDAGGSLDWSPNGRWVLFQNHAQVMRSSTVWLMHPNGENRHRITTTAGGTVTWESGSFSPDGQRIVVVQGASISVLSKRGDILQTITASAVDVDPDWGSRPN